MDPNRQHVAQMASPFIDGASFQSQGDGIVEIKNPSDGQTFSVIPRGDDQDVDRAVTSARRAFTNGLWSDAPPSHRKRILHQFADQIAANSAELDKLDAGEMGKPIREPRANATGASSLMRFYAESVDKITGEVYASDRNSFVAQRRVPRGVIGALIPWNFPTFNAILKLAPALAGGNSVVLKPSELSSRSALRLAEMAVSVGLPPGVLNVTPGLGDTVGSALARHGDVDMVTFTGSTEVGKKIIQYAGHSNMKVVLAECGGKSPQIVFDDGVDLKAAADSIAHSILTNQGQVCSAGSRLLVQRSIEFELLDKIATRVRQITMGNALDPRTTYGPVASANHCSRIMEYIESAGAEGAELVAGGRRSLKETGGYFIEPTIFRNVSPEARVAQEEVFGPVLSVIAFESEEDAIRIANGTKYSLAAYLWTSQISRGLRVAKAIRSLVLVNAVAPAGEGPGFASSFEPSGHSGIGVEGGVAGLESYLRRQTIWINHA